MPRDSAGGSRHSVGHQLGDDRDRARGSHAGYAADAVQAQRGSDGAIRKICARADGGGSCGGAGGHAPVLWRSPSRAFQGSGGCFDQRCDGECCGEGLTAQDRLRADVGAATSD